MIKSFLLITTEDLAHLVKHYEFIGLDAWPTIQSHIDKLCPQDRSRLRALLYDECNHFYGGIMLDFGITFGSETGYQITYRMPEFVITYNQKEVCVC